MTNQSIFGGQTNGDQSTNTNSTSQTNGSAQNNSTTSQVFTYQDGERTKEFKTAEDLYNGYVHSQEFIKTLKTEKDELSGKLQDLEASLKELMNRQVSAEEILSSLKQAPAQQQGQATNTTPVINQDAIVTAVKERLAQETRQQAETRNLAEAESALTKVYGDKALEQVTKIAGENGMTLDEVKALAMTKPKLFQNLFLPKGDNSSRTTTVTQSSVNTRALEQTNNNNTEWKPISQMSDTEAAAELRRRREELRKKYNL